MEGDLAAKIWHKTMNKTEAKFSRLSDDYIKDSEGTHHQSALLKVITKTKIGKNNHKECNITFSVELLICHDYIILVYSGNSLFLILLIIQFSAITTYSV